MASKNNKLIRFAEYVVVSAAAVGAIATITTKQSTYAVVPLSLAAVLSLVDRHSQQSAIASIDREQQTICQSIETLQKTVAQQALQPSDFASSQRLVELAEALKQLQTQTETRLETLADSATLETLAAQVEHLRQTSADTAQLAAEVEKINRAIAPIETLASVTSVSQLSTQLDAAQSQQTKALTGLRSDFDQLQAQLNALIAKSESEEASGTEEPTMETVVPQLPTEDNCDLDINLGIDFGTGYTKVCFYDVGREQAEIVTFSTSKNKTLTLEETLLPTKLAILEDGTLLSGLTVAEWQNNTAPIKKEIDFIKMRLAHLDIGEGEWRLEQFPELDEAATVESCCAYYLAQVVERSQQWIITHRPDLFANQTVRWSINVGVPVEYCDSKVLARFEEVLKLAWLLKYTPVPKANLTLPELNRLIAHLRTWKAEHLTTALDCTTTPEIAAAVWSFLSSREAQNGFYTFFDVGDGTLDGASFRFWRSSDGELRVDFYSGQVEPLGVTAFTQQAAAELNSQPDAVKAALTNSADKGLQRKMKGSKIRRSIQSLVAAVIFDGKEKHQTARRSSAADDVGDQLKVFIGGGGGNTTFFQSTIESTHSDFKQGNADIPPYQIRQIPPPKMLAINGIDPKDFNRFAVAYGLCIPNWERPDIKLPSEVEVADSYLETEYDSTTKYEDTRDLM